jgi:hypothetical protein
MSIVRDQIDQRDRAEREVRDLRDSLRDIRRECERHGRGLTTATSAVLRVGQIANRALGDSPPERPYLEPVA